MNTANRRDELYNEHYEETQVDDRYWDVFVEYAKDGDEPDNIYIRITAYNRGPDPATLHIIPQLWFPNTRSWPLEKPPMPLDFSRLHGGQNETLYVKDAFHDQIIPSH
ncbi:hypothetical protein F5880DRAFT_1687825 [Lentinula raphanica]|nr:hypothetical protein F5880DRAFT_1687825 [Lentinula raphanica]